MVQGFFFFFGEEQVTREEAPTAKSTNGMNKHRVQQRQPPQTPYPSNQLNKLQKDRGQEHDKGRAKEQGTTNKEPRKQPPLSPPHPHPPTGAPIH